RRFDFACPPEFRRWRLTVRFRMSAAVLSLATNSAISESDFGVIVVAAAGFGPNVRFRTDRMPRGWRALDLSPDLLAHEQDVGDREADHRQRDDRHGLRPNDEQALVQRQERWRRAAQLILPRRPQQPD